MHEKIYIIAMFVINDFWIQVAVSLLKPPHGFLELSSSRSSKGHLKPLLDPVGGFTAVISPRWFQK
jgi:hypothetical protein